MFSADSEALVRSYEQSVGLEGYPAFSDAVVGYQYQIDDFLATVQAQTLQLAPDGYVEIDDWPGVSVASPHMTVALSLKLHGAPLGITAIEHPTDKPGYSSIGSVSIFTLWAAPEIATAYNELWSSLFNEPTRQLANSITTGSISFREAFRRNIMIAPMVNKHILWGYTQHILPRAYVTSMLHQFFRDGANPDYIRSVASEAEAVETLLTEHDVRPLSLETVMGIGLAGMFKVLAQTPGLSSRLKLDLTSLPSIDEEKLRFSRQQHVAAFASYWAPVLKAMGVD